MLFYHYSTEFYQDLRSLVAQGKTGQSSRTERNAGFFDHLEAQVIKLIDRIGLNSEFNYDRHISLFLEPIPLDIAQIYFHRHAFWKTGLSLFEYQVSLHDLPENISFMIVESPEKTNLLYHKQDWDKAKEFPELISVYKKQILEMEKRKGYIGHGRDNLLSVAKKFSKGGKRYFQEAAQIARKYPEDGGFSKYAACVPHLMIYPGYKPISYLSVREIVLK